MGLRQVFEESASNNREGSMIPARDDRSELKRTPLHALHVASGGKMVPFAGYDMPVQFASGVLREHLHTRSHAGLFDVSHMGQIALHPKSGKVEDAALALERLVPQDILGVPAGRQRYAQFTNGAGGILDDLMVANFGSHLFLVVNAACKAEDEAHLRASLSESCVIESLPDRALIALQGPKAESVLAKLCADVALMRFMDAGPRGVDGLDCFVSRSGYTGEDGFEISVPAEHAEPLAKTLLGNSDVLPIGLGARDSLRLEAGLCLYCHDIGVTDYAQSQLGDVVFVELPKVGRSLKKAEAAAVVESVKAASDVYAPISGEVLEINDALAAEPALVNSDAGGKAWFFKIKIADKGELGGLMDEAAYAKHTA